MCLHDAEPAGPHLRSFSALLGTFDLAAVHGALRLADGWRTVPAAVGAELIVEITSAASAFLKDPPTGSKEPSSPESLESEARRLAVLWLLYAHTVPDQTAALDDGLRDVIITALTTVADAESRAYMPPVTADPAE